MPISTPSPDNSLAPNPPFRTTLSDAARYWEPRRILYNLALTIVVIAWLAATWPHFRPALVPATMAPMLFLAIVANLCYCAAYPIDLLAQQTPFRSLWQKRRWGLWLAGTLFAILLANYWIADEIYPDVH